MRKKQLFILIMFIVLLPVIIFGHLMQPKEYEITNPDGIELTASFPDIVVNQGSAMVHIVLSTDESRLLNYINELNIISHEVDELSFVSMSGEMVVQNIPGFLFLSPFIEQENYHLIDWNELHWSNIQESNNSILFTASYTSCESFEGEFQIKSSALYECTYKDSLKIPHRIHVRIPDFQIHQAVTCMP